MFGAIFHGFAALVLVAAGAERPGAAEPAGTRVWVAEAAPSAVVSLAPSSFVQQGGQGRGQGEPGARGQGGGQQGGAARGQAAAPDRPEQGQGRGQAQARQGGNDQEQGAARGNQQSQQRPTLQAQQRGSQGQGNQQAQPRGNQGQGNQQAQPRGNQGQGNQQAGPGTSPGQERSAAAPGRASAPGANARGGNAPAAASGSGGGASARALNASGAPGRLAPAELQRRIAELPAAVRGLADSPRASERMLVGALARGKARGLDPNPFDIRVVNGQARVLNGRGELLLDLDEDRARRLGAWELRRLGDHQPRGNAPSFCRSGEGHPVWGREWCLDKGFGLGSSLGTIWSRGRIDDVIFRRPSSRDRLDRGGLLDVLGDIVLGRLALHALTLGYADPLGGVWLTDPQGPQILHVYSGPLQVAEFVDLDRDGRPEVLYVVQPQW